MSETPESTGFLAVPNDLLDWLGIDDWHIAVDLFRRGRSLRWRTFSITESSSCTRWKCSNRRMWGVIDVLVELGHAEVERGGPRKPSRITMRCPTRKPNEEEDDAQRSRQRKSLPPKEEIEEPAAQDDAKDNAEPDAPATEDPPPAFALEIAPATRSTRAGTTRKRPAEFTEALRVWNEEVVPAVRSRGGSVSVHDGLTAAVGLGQALRKRLDAAGLEAVLAVFRWYATSLHPRAVFLRSSGNELATLIGPTKFGEYLAMSRAPEPAAGTPPPTPGGRPPVGRAGDGVLERALEREREKLKNKGRDVWEAESE